MSTANSGKPSPTIFISAPGRRSRRCGSSRKSTALEHLQQAHELGKGALMVTAHFGLFELGGLLLAQHGFPVRRADLSRTEPRPDRMARRISPPLERRYDRGRRGQLRLPANRRAPAPGPICRHADRPASSHGQHAGFAAERDGPFFRGHSSACRAWRRPGHSRHDGPRQADGTYHAQDFSAPFHSRNAVRARKLSGFTASRLRIRFFPSYAPIPNNGTNSCRFRATP